MTTPMTPERKESLRVIARVPGLVVPSDLAEALDEIDRLNVFHAEEVAEFNAGWQAAQDGKPEDEPPDVVHDQWRVGYAWFHWDATKARLRRLEAALADEGLVHYATDYALINTLDAFDVYRDQLRTAAQAEPGEPK